jgi:N-acetylneuraminic acid mutarotase
VHVNGIIYTFGGYDAYDKLQLSSCEYYDMAKDQWHNSPHDGKVEFKLNKERSQTSCCQFDNDLIFIFGGYNRNEGTLNLIERFFLKSKRMELLELKMP